MSLKLNNPDEPVTDKQTTFLKELGYYGNPVLTKREAETLINEYLEQNRQEMTNDQRTMVERLSHFDPQYLQDYKDKKGNIRDEFERIS